MMKKYLAKGIFIVCLGVISTTVYADHHRTNDHEKARQALLNGDVLSLQEVLDLVQKQQSGTPIEIEFDYDHGRYEYEIKLLRDNGNIAKLKIDATNGDILKIKERTKSH